MTIKFNVKNGFPVKLVVRSNKIIKTPTKSNSTIPLKLRGNGLPPGRDFMYILKKIDQLKNKKACCYISWIFIRFWFKLWTPGQKMVFLFKNSNLNIIQD